MHFGCQGAFVFHFQFFYHLCHFFFNQAIKGYVRKFEM